ncbi:F-box only protein 44-like [Acanthaster planci]|uniref:F-box only protein 44-like n=1 Tax=Acanthaster planci TaxID=133434 RepID=A0A8B7ZH60_ACAPL|nr:F-box only protein 44-like [Acanthaster planci]
MSAKVTKKSRWLEREKVGVLEHAHLRHQRAPRKVGLVSLQSLPNELLTHILSFVPWRWLPNCALVCKAWKGVFSGKTFWHDKCHNCLRIRRFVDGFMAPYVPRDWKKFYFERPCTRNLIKNPSGKDGLSSGWIYPTRSDKWQVEMGDSSTATKPDRLLAVSDGSPHHFVPCEGSCLRYQVIDLLAEGFTPAILDGDQPDVVISEWYTSPPDFFTTFNFKVELLKQEESAAVDNVIESFRYRPMNGPNGTPNEWQEVMTRFYKYGPGLRFIRFSEQTTNSSTPSGTKIAGCVIKLEFRNRVCEWDV